jgi:hypothetical protein
VILTGLIAKGFVLIDYLLDFWTDEGAVVSISNSCFSFDILNVTVSDCGQSYFMAELIEDAFELAMLPTILAGVFAYSY